MKMTNLMKNAVAVGTLLLLWESNPVIARVDQQQADKLGVFVPAIEWLP